jgi:hypothetical protein
LKEKKAKTPQRRTKKVAYIQADPCNDYNDSDGDVDDDIFFDPDTSMQSNNGEQIADINIGKSFESCQE